MRECSKESPLLQDLFYCLSLTALVFLRLNPEADLLLKAFVEDVSKISIKYLCLLIHHYYTKETS